MSLPWQVTDVRLTKQHSAYLNSSLGSLKLLLQGLVSGQEGAAQPLLLTEASLPHTYMHEFHNLYKYA